MITRQQYGFALNRLGDWRRAERVLNNVIEEFGDSAETYGLLGRVYKERFKAAETVGAEKTGYLNKAIAAYTKGFESEPMDYYPGVNAITLLLLKDDQDAHAEIKRLLPLVTFAVLRQGGAESSDYWTLATVLELAMVGKDRELAKKVLPNLLTTDAEGWMFQTTLDNLDLILHQQKDEDFKAFMQQCIDEIKQKL